MKKIDILHGSIWDKVLAFALPLAATSVLQQLFNSADVAVVGQFSGSKALAAVGSTSPITSLFITIFVGLSIGTNVVISRFLGAQNDKQVKKAVHTSLVLSVISGIIIALIGELIAKWLLVMMSTPAEVLDQALLFLRITFIGMIFLTIYNFESAILRASGDTKRPLYCLLISGVINVSLGLFFVVICKLDVAGVALATIISEGISSALILLCLKHMDGPLHFELKDMRFHKDLALQMLEVGLPAGLQGIIFSISNVLIQSSVNSFGSLVMAGNTAASNIEGFVYTSMNAVYQTSLSFTSQNFGAKKYNRIDKILLECLGIVTVVGLVLGQGAYFFGQQLLSIYSSDEHVIQFGIDRLAVISTMYCLCGIMDTLVGSLRGIGYSILPMLVSLTGVCVIRVIWIFTVFKSVHTTFSLYISYPITWVITLVAHGICFMVVRKKIRRVA